MTDDLNSPTVDELHQSSQPNPSQNQKEAPTIKEIEALISEYRDMLKNRRNELVAKEFRYKTTYLRRLDVESRKTWRRVKSKPIEERICVGIRLYYFNKNEKRTSRKWLMKEFGKMWEALEDAHSKLRIAEERLSQMKATLRKIDKMDVEQRTLIGELEVDEEEEVETRGMSTQTDEVGMADAQTQTEG